jgi:MFS family permease
MYQIDSGSNALKNKAISSDIPHVVFWVGMTSLLTDISSEMIASVLPIFLYTVMNLSPLQVGIFDGLYQGSAAFVRVIAGYLADRSSNNRAVAFTGYALSAFARLVLLLATFFFGGFVLLALVFDRIGKGMRSAPRDAIIAGHSKPEVLAAAMGLHRRMDALGAFVGPLVAAALLLWWPMEFTAIFSISLFFALLGLIVFWFRVSEPPRTTLASNKESSSENTTNTTHATALSITTALRLVFSNSSFLGLVALTIALSVFTISEGLIYLSLQQAFKLEAHWMPLMFVATAFVFVLTALHIGRLADRLGAVNVFLAGYALLALSYVWFAFGVGSLRALGDAGLTLELGLLVILMGLHYAATDGILAVLAIQYLPMQVRTTGLALITTATGLTKIGSSTLYGWLWQLYDPATAAQTFAIAAILCWCLAVYVLYARRANM